MEFQSSLANAFPLVAGMSLNYLISLNSSSSLESLGSCGMVLAHKAVILSCGRPSCKVHLMRDWSPASSANLEDSGSFRVGT